jgi:uncharacterized protein YuzB (UPF0349 family)
VSRESIRIEFTYAALNHLDVCAADIRNAYIQASSSRKDYIVCGAEFGLEHVGKVALIHRTLVKRQGRTFKIISDHACITFTLYHAQRIPMYGCVPFCSTCYEYVLQYTNDVMVISENAEAILRRGIGKYFELKEDSIGSPKIYIGGRVRRVQLYNGVYA